MYITNPRITKNKRGITKGQHKRQNGKNCCLSSLPRKSKGKKGKKNRKNRKQRKMVDFNPIISVKSVMD